MNNENDIIFDFPFHLFCSSSYQIHRKIINLAVDGVVAVVVAVVVAAEEVPSDAVN